MVGPDLLELLRADDLLGRSQTQASNDLAKRMFVPRSVFIASAVGGGIVNLVLSLIPLLLIVLVTGFPLYATWAFPPGGGLHHDALHRGRCRCCSSRSVSRFADVREMYIVHHPDLVLPDADRLRASIVPVRYRIPIWPEPAVLPVQTFRKPIYDGVLPSRRPSWCSLSMSLVVLVMGWVTFCHRADDLAYWAEHGRAARSGSSTSRSSTASRGSASDRSRSTRSGGCSGGSSSTISRRCATYLPMIGRASRWASSGRNGAGKSTLLPRHRPRPASVSWAGSSSRDGSLRSWSSGLGFHGELTGRENVLLQGVPPRLLARRDAAADGSDRRVRGARRLHRLPDADLLDRNGGPALLLGRDRRRARHPARRRGLSPSATSAFSSSATNGWTPFRSRGKDLHARLPLGRPIATICDRAIWIHAGAVVADGPADEVTEAYHEWSMAGGAEPPVFAPRAAASGSV